MLKLASANREKRQVKKEKDHAESEHEKLLGGYEDLRQKYNTLVDNHNRL